MDWTNEDDTTFGVSGYTVKSVARRFERDFARYDRSQEATASDFSVRQVREVLGFRPGSATYLSRSAR